MVGEGRTSLENEANRATPVALASEQYAFAEHMDLHHWDKPQVTVFVEGGDTQQIVEKAALLWNQPTQQVVQTVITDKPSADILVRFVPAESLPPQVLGRTTISYGALSGKLCHAVIAVQQGLSEERCLQAVAHELGHALGIQGHSPYASDLMFDRAHLPATVTQRDANTLRIGYGKL